MAMSILQCKACKNVITGTPYYVREDIYVTVNGVKTKRQGYYGREWLCKACWRFENEVTAEYAEANHFGYWVSSNYYETEAEQRVLNKEKLKDWKYANKEQQSNGGKSTDTEITGKGYEST